MSEENTLPEVKLTDSQKVRDLEKNDKTAQEEERRPQFLQLYTEQLTVAINVFLQNTYWAWTCSRDCAKSWRYNKIQDTEAARSHKGYIPVVGNKQVGNRLNSAMQEGKKADKTWGMWQRVWLTG